MEGLTSHNRRHVGWQGGKLCPIHTQTYSLQEVSPMSSIAYGGLDVHKDSISVFVVNKGTGEVVEDKIAFDKRKVREAVRLWSKLGELRLCYEASGTGFVLKRWFDELGVHCDVIAPSLIPKAPGDRVKTDKRDARKLAMLYGAGLLKVVRVPSREDEAVRALLRLRESVTREIVRNKNRIIKYVRTLGYVYGGKSHWTKGHREWVGSLEVGSVERMILDTYLEQLEEAEKHKEVVDKKIEEIAETEAYRSRVERLKCLKGIGTYTAMVALSEIGDPFRFAKAGQVMSYVGLVSREDSTGGRRRTGPITKAGNSHARWVLTEAAWNQLSKEPGKRQQEHWKTQPVEVVEIAKKAQQRLHKKFWGLAMRKDRNIAATAVAREMVGFIWAILTVEVAVPKAA